LPESETLRSAQISDPQKIRVILSAAKNLLLFRVVHGEKQILQFVQDDPSIA
jgi:hypothetical protein